MTCALTLVAQNSATLLPLSTSILKKAGVEGCPVAKLLTCKFKAKTAHAPDGADCAGAAEVGQHEEQAPPPPAAVEAAAAAARALRQRRPPKAKGENDRTAEGQAGPSVNQNVLVLALISNTELLAGQNRSRDSGRKA